MLSDSHSKGFVKGPTRSRFCSPPAIYNALRLAWVVLIILGELGSVYWTLARCRWPSFDNNHGVKPTHILLISDTQVQALHPRANFGLISSFRRALFDINLRKHWHVASHLNPDAVIFLGDMLANGKGAHNREEYEQEVRKFKAIFGTDENAEVHYVPGNEDVGLGFIASISNNLRSYYKMNFGPLNTNFVIANHTFVALDAPGLVDEDYHRHASRATFDDWKPIPDGPVSFVKEISGYGPSNLILLSHIPLSRSETANCGPHRERGGIRRSAGPGYQSMLGKHTTSFLLKNLEPLVVFSGDNHDYCDYTHIIPGAQPDIAEASKSVREVTIKSFASSPHINRPGFQLLSLVDPASVSTTDTKSFADRLCLLPDQHKIYTSMYLPNLFVTLIILLILQYRGRRPKPLRNIDTLSPFSPSPRSSGRNTPALNDHMDLAQLSATWSPYSPTIPVSPRATLPSDFRIPRSPSISTTRLVASLPGSPGPSSPATFTVPLHYSREDNGEDDDTMYPTQYVSRRDSYPLRQREDDEWSHVRDEEDYDIVHSRDDAAHDLLLSPNHQPEFISALSQAKGPIVSNKRTLSWSYTFVFKGRRRRISLSLPSWKALTNLLDFFGFGPEATTATRKRKRGVVAFPIAALSVLWPAIIVWVIINGTIF